MSGICGIVRFDGALVDRETLRAMADASAFRGPDGINLHVDDSVGVAHLALNITPESRRESQPLHTADGRLVLVADARVDNRDDLISLLAPGGFVTAEAPSDADLLLGAYEKWGTECAAHIVGDFAFAVWDSTEQRLFMARDAVGVRPLCYSSDGSTLRFASDPRQILADPAVSRDLDGVALADLLVLNPHPTRRTVFAAVKRLKQGHFCVATRDGIRASRHWHPDRAPDVAYSSDEEYAAHFRELLWRCVADRFRSSRDSAVILTSGGIDSSSVAAIAQDLFASGATSVKPIAASYVFDEYPTADERKYVEALHDETGIELEQVLADDYPWLVDSEAFTPEPDSAVMHDESLTGHVLRRAAAQGAGVVMNGFGGDSMFHAAQWAYVEDVRVGRWWRMRPWIEHARSEGGSWRWIAWSHFVWPLLPDRARQAADRRLQRGRYRHVPAWIAPELSAQVDLARRLYEHGEATRYSSPVRQRQYVDLVGTRDRTSAIEWLNLRAAKREMDATFPLMDRRLAEFVLHVPLRLCARVGRRNTKWVFRAAMGGTLPEAIRTRPDKTNWTPYYRHSVCSEAQAAILDLFTNTRLACYNLVQERKLKDEYLAHCSGSPESGDTRAFVGPILVEKWLRTHAASAEVAFHTRVGE